MTSSSEKHESGSVTGYPEIIHLVGNALRFLLAPVRIRARPIPRFADFSSKGLVNAAASGGINRTTTSTLPQELRKTVDHGGPCSSCMYSALSDMLLWPAPTTPLTDA